MRNYKKTLSARKADALIRFLKDQAILLDHKKGKYITFDTDTLKHEMRLKPRFRSYTIIYKKEDSFKVFMTEKEESLKALIESL